MDSNPQLILSDHVEASRFELRADGELVGFVDYRADGANLRLVHTEVVPAFAGKGMGGKLARAVLDEVRARSVQVRPTCEFLATWIERHPDYADLVAP